MDFLINQNVNEIEMDEGMLLMVDNCEDILILGSFEHVLWKEIKKKPNNYEDLKSRLIDQYENFNEEGFRVFFDELMKNQIIIKK